MRILMHVLLVSLAALLLAGICVFPALAAKKTPPGSYLRNSVTSVDELRTQVANDSVVRSRYSIHFGISAQDLDEYIASNLQITTLKQPLRVQVWYVDKHGRTSVKTKNLPKGTKVFSTKEGKPVLQWACGNPLTTQLPKVEVTSQSESAVAALPEESPITAVETRVLPAPEEIITSAVVMAPPVTEVVAALPVVAAPAMQAAVAPAVSFAPAVVAAAGAGGGMGGILGVLGGLGAVAGLAGGGGGGSSSPAIPEPSSLLALMGCLTAVPAALRFKRK